MLQSPDETPSVANLFSLAAACVIGIALGKQRID